jgi:hypothetical protein
MTDITTATGATEIRHTIGATGNFALRNVSGRIRLSGIDGDEAIVRVRTDSGREPRLNVERTDGGLLVEPERQSRSMLGLKVTIDFDHAYDFDVQLPRRAHLDIKTVSADVEAHDLTGEQNYKTVSGDIRLTRVSGRVNAMTVSGDARLHDGGELEFDGATTSGDVTVEATLVQRLGVRTISGDVRVVGGLLAGPRHAVETVSGDLQIETESGVTIDSTRALDFGRRDRGPAVFGDGAARLLFRSMSGDQRVRQRGAPAKPQPSSEWGFPTPPTPPTSPTPPTTPTPPTPPTTPVGSDARIDILRALERGEIDVDEASRRLEGAHLG